MSPWKKSGGLIMDLATDDGSLDGRSGKHKRLMHSIKF